MVCTILGFTFHHCGFEFVYALKADAVEKPQSNALKKALVCIYYVCYLTLMLNILLAT